MDDYDVILSIKGQPGLTVCRVRELDQDAAFRAAIKRCDLERRQVRDAVMVTVRNSLLCSYVATL